MILQIWPSNFCPSLTDLWTVDYFLDNELSLPSNIFHAYLSFLIPGFGIQPSLTFVSEFHNQWGHVNYVKMVRCTEENNLIPAIFRIIIFIRQTWIFPHRLFFHHVGLCTITVFLTYYWISFRPPYTVNSCVQFFLASVTRFPGNNHLTLV